MFRNSLLSEITQLKKYIYIFLLLLITSSQYSGLPGFIDGRNKDDDIEKLFFNFLTP